MLSSILLGRYKDEIIRREVPDVNKAFPFSGGQTLLHLSVIAAVRHESDDLELVQKLCDHPGIDVNVSDNTGNSPLHIVLQEGGSTFHDVVEALLLRSAQVDVCNHAGLTPTMMAVQNSSFGVVTLRALLFAGADNLVASLLSHEGRLPDIPKLLEQPSPQVPVNDVVMPATGDNLLHHVLQRPGLSIEYQRSIVQKLCRFGHFDVNTLNKHRCSGLHLTSDEIVVKSLLERKAQTNTKNSKGDSPLISMLNRRQVRLNVVSLLLGADADVNTKDFQGHTALHAALWHGHQNLHQLVGLLLGAKALVNTWDSSGTSLASDAASLQYIELRTLSLLFHAGATGLLKCLLDQKARLIYHDIPEMLEDPSPQVPVNDVVMLATGDNLLHHVLQLPGLSIEYHKSIVQKLCKFGHFNVNALNKHGCSGLHLTSDEIVVKSLLERKAQTNTKNSNGDSPLISMLKHGQVKLNVISLMLGSNADVNTKDFQGRSALHVAFWLGHQNLHELVRLLLEAKALVNTCDSSGTSVASMAAGQDSVELRTLSLLLRAGASDLMNCLLEQKQRPLYPAVEHLIAEPTLDVNGVVVKSQGCSLLHVVLQASWSASHRISLWKKLLVRADVDMTVVDLMGRNALHAALLSGEQSDKCQIVKLLLQKDVDVNKLDKDNRSPLHIAADTSAWSSLRQLVKAAADVNAKDAYGCSPMQILLATAQPCPSAVKDLVSDDLNVNHILDIGRGQTILHIVLDSGCTWARPRRWSLLSKLCKHPHINLIKADAAGQTPLHLSLLGVNLNEEEHDEEDDDWHQEDEVDDEEDVFFLAEEDVHEDVDEIENFGLHALVDILLKARADVNAKNSSGATPIDNAINSELIDAKLFALLMRAGANIIPELLLRSSGSFVPILMILFEERDLHFDDVVDKDTNRTLLQVLLCATWAAPQRLDLVSRLCKTSEVDINHTDSAGRTALHLMLSAGYSRDIQQPILNELLNCSAEVNATDRQGIPLLHTAAAKPDLEIGVLPRLLRATADINTTDPQGRTCLHTALCAGNGGLTNILIKQGLNINATDEKMDSHLHLAARLSKWNAVKSLAEAGADVNMQNSNGHTPVQELLMTDEPCPSACEALLTHTLDVNHVFESSWTLLHHILCDMWPAGRRTAMVAKLCNRSEIHVNKYTRNKFYKSKPIFFKHSEDIYGCTALHLAFLGGDLYRDELYDICTSLLQARADLEAKDTYGETPVDLAVRATSVEPRVLSLLLHWGAHSLVVLLLLQRHDRILSTIEGLIDDGLDLNRVVKAKEGRTLLHVVLLEDWANSCRATLVAKLCSCQNMDVNVADSKGQTALHVALRQQKSFPSLHPQEIIHGLLQAGGNIGVKDRKGQTPAEIAVTIPTLELCTLMMMHTKAEATESKLLSAEVHKRFQDLKISEQRLNNEVAKLRKTCDRLDWDCRQLKSSEQRLKEEVAEKEAKSERLQREQEISQQHAKKFVDELRREIYILEQEVAEKEAKSERLQREEKISQLAIDILAQEKQEIEERNQVLEQERHFSVPSWRNERLSIQPAPTIFDNRREKFFREAESQFLRQLKSNKVLQKAFQVARIEVNLNGQLWQRYANRRAQQGYTEERWGFHGTDSAALQSIIQGGFEIGGQGVNLKHGAACGPGVYLANSPDLAMNFQQHNQMIMAQFYTAGAHTDRDAWVVKNKMDVFPKYIIHFK